MDGASTIVLVGVAEMGSLLVVTAAEVLRVSSPSALPKAAETELESLPLLRNNKGTSTAAATQAVAQSTRMASQPGRQYHRFRLNLTAPLLLD